MDAYKKLNTPKGAALHIEFSSEPVDEKAEMRLRSGRLPTKWKAWGGTGSLR